MDLKLRPGTPEDAVVCGDICYRAFAAIAQQHGFPPDFPSAEFGIHIHSLLLEHPRFYSVVAESGGKVIGSNYLDERCPIAGIGPVTVDPEAQNQRVGRALMDDVLDRVREKSYPGVRLVQASYHNRSLCLYAKLGFDAREPLSVMQGPPLRREIPGFAVRKASEEDLEACNRLCRQNHGRDRSGHLSDAIADGTATVVQRAGRIAGYATVVGLTGHAVAETNDDLKALIAAADGFFGPGFLLPTRNAELFRWCLANGLRVVEPMTLMTMGEYSEPGGVYLPSILY